MSKQNATKRPPRTDSELLVIIESQLEYCPEEGAPETGYFKWKVAKSPIQAGDWAGYVITHGYRKIELMGVVLAEHRLVYLLTHGHLPTQIDHKNGIKTDNRPENLRPATRTQNGQNRKIQQNNSGYKGVHRRKTGHKFSAAIRVNKILISLGNFDCPIKAAEAYDAAALKHFGEFARINFPAQQSA